jgi:ligand-binding sensor domain-containing protein
VVYCNKYIALVLFALMGYGKHMGQKLRFERYTVEDGLQNNIVLAAAEDAKGLMWFATATGIARFDGSHFYHRPFGCGTDCHTAIEERE